MGRAVVVIVLFLLFPVPRAGAVRTDDAVWISDFSSGTDAAGVPRGWEVKEKSGTADFSIVNDGGIWALRLRSDKTSFSIQRPVTVDLRRHPLLTWKWKVTKLPLGGDFRHSKTDDQAAQLFLAFTKTRAIVYIWDTSAPQGLMQDAPAPFFMTIKAVVVRSGTTETGRWLTETRNVRQDYRNLFGEEPPAVSGIRLQINSQHTGASAESYFSDVLFRKE